MKARSEHTLGPWTINPAHPRDHHRDSRIVDDAGDCIAIVRGEDVVDSIHIANSRLIAAAPDLLAVCEEIEQHGMDDWDARMKTLRAAIAKARGR